MILALRRSVLLLTLALCARPQAIEFESNGLKYQTLTRNGVTIMFAHLASHVREYSILQVAVSNGSGGPYTIRPEEFWFMKADGAAIQGSSAKEIVSVLIDKGGRGDVIKLVSAYETALYGMRNMRSTNGYEARRQAALAMVSSTRLKAAAAASAIALAQIRLKAGESTDGAVFFAAPGHHLSNGRLVVRTNTDVFEFNAE